MGNFLGSLFGNMRSKSSRNQDLQVSKFSGNEYSLTNLSASPLFTNDPKSTDDDQMNKEVRDLMRAGNWEEALKKSFAGLRTCSHKDRFCEAIGDICLERDDVTAIGWYMQACLICSHNWEPYLLVTYAAQDLGWDEMAWRCLNATDVIGSGHRIPEFGTKIVRLVREFYSEQLPTAFQNFNKAMDPYLPAADEIPHDSSFRYIFLKQNITGDPNMAPIKQWLRLMNRNP